MKRRWPAGLAVVIVLGAVGWWLSSAGTTYESPLPGVASYRHFLDLDSDTTAQVDRAIKEIERGWHPGAPIMLLEIVRFVPTRHAFEATFALLERKTGQRFDRSYDGWYQWLWEREYDPHPEYARFKGELYARIDERFCEYFQQADRTLIRLDEIVWGGVLRDGIPPLKNPKMIPAEQAAYLDDSNIVFGVKLNGDARCYPKRILAWHEMFKDTIGGVSVCGAY